MRRAQLIASLLVVGGTALAVPGVPQAADRPAAPRQEPERTRGNAPERAPAVLPAAYGPAIRSVTVMPRDPVVRARGGVDLTVEVVARGAAAPDAVTVRVEPGPPPPPPPSARARTGGAIPPARSLPAELRPSGWDGGGWETWRFRAPVKLSRLYPPGVWTVEARVRGASGRQAVEHETFLLRGLTRLRGLRVTQERADEDAVRVSGRLTRLDPSGLRGQRGFPGRKVAIQYLGPRADVWRTAAWTVTGRGGGFAASVPQRDAVRWRVVYEGDDRHAPVDGQVGGRDGSSLPG